LGLDRIGKEILRQIEVPTQHLLARAEESHKNPQITNPELYRYPYYVAGTRILVSIFRVSVKTDFCPRMLETKLDIT
jgi:hypothetical protein